MNQKPRTERSRVRREPHRGHYDRETIHAVLDAGMIAHVGFVNADGHPLVIPMLYARDHDRLLIHGSSASRLLNRLDEGIDVCVTVTIGDGLVVARSGAKWEALRLLTEFLIPGRWEDCRQPNDQELKATWILEMPINEASAKIRTGGPNDEQEDLALSYWAGVIPLAKGVLPPVPHEKLRDGIELPDYLESWNKNR